MRNNRLSWIFCLILISLLPVSAFAGYGTADFRVITAKSGLNIRFAPSASSRKITSVPHLAVVKVLQKQARMVTIGTKRGHWTRIQWLTNYGWVFDAWTVPVTRGLAGMSFRTTTTGTDYIPELYFKNSRTMYYVWGSVGSMGYRMGRYTISGNRITVSFFREVRLVNQNPPTASTFNWKKTINKTSKTKTFTIDVGLDHKTGYVVLIRGEELFKRMPDSTWKAIRSIDSAR